MAISNLFTFSFTVIFLLLNSTISSSESHPLTYTGNSSSIAANQLKFWSQNVQNKIPKGLLSKLSPLSDADSAYYASLPLRQSLFSNGNFCSLAHLSCSSKVSHITVLGFKYNGYVESTPVDHIDPHLFFRLLVLKEGKKVHLPNLLNQYPDRAFLPYQIACKISVNSVKLKQILPQSIDDTTKRAIQTTLLYCTGSTIKGERKSCPTSLEDTIKFSKDILGNKQLFALTSEIGMGSQKELKISKIKQFDSDKIVSCHEVYLPFFVYFCHTVSSTRLYKVDVIEPKTGALVNTLVAVCHMDTSTWPPNHVAFKVLESEPGKGEACHWMSKLDLVWIGGDEQTPKTEG